MCSVYCSHAPGSLYCSRPLYFAYTPVRITCVMMELSVLCVCRHQPVSFMAKFRRFLRQRPLPSTQDLLMVSWNVLLSELGSTGGRVSQCGHHSQLPESHTLDGLPHLTNNSCFVLSCSVRAPKAPSSVLFQTFSTAHTNIGICFRDLLPLSPTPPLPLLSLLLSFFHPLRCCQAVWLLDHHQLPRGLQDVCLQWDPLQPREPPKR